MSGTGNGHRGEGEGRVRSFARRRFGEKTAVEPLAGDASDRSFFRIRPPGLSSLVAMVHPEPFRLDDLPWFHHALFLRGIGAAVPEIVGSWPGEGILLVQDLGDDTLMHVLDSATPERRHFLYRQAVQIIVALQSEGTPALTPDLPAARMALDAERLLFELRFFHEHYVAGLMEGPLVGEEETRLDEFFVELVAAVTATPFVLCHRDYHSRNLMLRGERLYMVDFQDARMGPWLYDLASLLRDSYVDLPEDLVEEMLEFFLEASEGSGTNGRSPGAGISREEAREQFELTALQRNIKALGTFAYQATVKGKRFYLGHVPRTIAHVRANLRSRGFGRILPLFEGPLDLQEPGRT